MTKTALVSLQGNTYQVDPLLVGHRVELVFDPFDLTTIAVRLPASRPGRRSRTGSAATPTSRPDPRPHPTRRRRPGSTTPASSTTPTTPNWRAAASTTPRSPAAATPPPAPSSRSTARTARPAHRPPRRHRPRTTPTIRDDSSRRGVVVIDRLQGFFGFTRTPFGRDLAPGMLHRHAGHGEAVARIGWCVAEHRDRGDHRRGRRREDRRRPRRARRTRPHPAHDHLPAQPDRRGPRDPPPDRHRARAPPTDPPRHAGPADRRRPRGRAGRTRPHPRRGDRRGPPARPRPARVDPHADQPRHGLHQPVRLPAGRASPPCDGG